MKLEDIINIGKQVKQTVEKPKKAIDAVVKEFSYSPQTLPQDWRYRAKKLSDTYQRNSPALTQIPYTKEPSVDEKLWKQATPMNRLGMAGILGDYTPTKTPSANHVREHYLAQPETPRGAFDKNQVLENYKLQPGLKSYLRSVQFSDLDPSQFDKAAGRFWSDNYGEEYIETNQEIQSRADQRRIAAHEALHVASFAIPDRDLGNFVTDINRSFQRDPQAFAPIMSWIKGYKEQYKDTGYFNDPRAEAQELFAEVGAQYGSSLVAHTLLGKYYANIFNNQQAQWPPMTITAEDGSIGYARK
jgi:hypothetical protein